MPDSRDDQGIEATEVHVVRPIELLENGALGRREARAMGGSRLSQLLDTVADRRARSMLRVRERLRWRPHERQVERESDCEYGRWAR